MKNRKHWLVLISFLTEETIGSMILGLKWKAAEEEPEPELSKPKTNRKKSPLKREEFINETKNDEEDMNEQIF